MHDINLIRAEDIARTLQMSVRHIAERVTLQPGFPKPYVFNGKGTRRWDAEEVAEWIRGQQLRG